MASNNYWLEQEAKAARQQGIDVMQVCRNGHISTPTLLGTPEENKPFCPACGSRTLSRCESCQHVIPGIDWGGFVSYTPDVPAYCIGCGSAYPWTAVKLAAIDELISEMDHLEPDERARLRASVRDFAIDSPRSELGMTRFKRLAKKAGETIGGSLYKMAVDVASEAAKKSLLGR